MTPESSSPAARKPDYLLPLLLWLGVVLVLRLIALYAARIDLVLDEAQYWTWGQDLAFGYFSKPPMIAWIMRGMTELCGSGEACVRSASPILHTLSAIVIYYIARELYDARIGFWSAVVFVTMPGVSYSSFLITTDVPLVLMWALALLAWVKLFERPTLRMAALLGIAAGFGLLAKYAMVYFLLCVVCQAIFSRNARQALGGGRGIVAFLIALVLISPNFFWNYAWGFPTFHHTAVNAGWKPPYFHLDGLGNYLLGQAGVFGPILFVTLFVAAWRAIRRGTDERETLLLSFSLPVIVLIAIQSLLSRAHGNWASVAYPAGVIFVTAALLDQWRRLFRLSLFLHIGAAIVIAVAPVFAPKLQAFERIQALSRVLGWHQLTAAVKNEANQGQYAAIVVDTRELAAELLYYLRGAKAPPLYVLPAGPVPLDQYEMTRPVTKATPEPILFVSLIGCGKPVKAAFAKVEEIGTREVPIGETRTRTVHFCRVSGYLR